MHHPAPWLLSVGLTVLIVGCGKETTVPGNDSPTTRNPDAQGKTPVTADQLVSNQGALYTRKSNSLFTGTLIENWESGKGGKQKYQCDYVDGQKHGVEMQWHTNGQRSVRTEFVNGQQHGARREWHLQGAQKALTQFVSGQPEGEAKGWHDNGKQAFRAVYTNGVPVGAVESWWKNGSRASYLAHVNGKASGAKVQWFPNGRTNSVTLFQAGVKEGSSLTWYDTGQKRMELRFVKGEADGPVSEWYKTGGRMSVTQYVNGKMHGLGQGWYPDGNLLWRGQWVMDQRDQIHTSYFPSGRAKMEVQYRQGVVLKKLRYNEQGQVVDSMVVPAGRTRSWDVEQLKAAYLSRNQQIIQAAFGKPDRIEEGVWVYTGMKILGDEIQKSILKFAFKNGIVVRITAADK